MPLRLGEISIDCTDPELVAAFWCAALGYRVTDRDATGVAIAGASSAPTVLFYQDPNPKKTKNRIHFDICPVDSTQEAEVQRLEGLGASRIDIGQGDASWVVMADPEGNEFCVMRTELPPEPTPFHHLDDPTT